MESQAERFKRNPVTEIASTSIASEQQQQNEQFPPSLLELIEKFSAGIKAAMELFELKDYQAE